MKVDKKAVVLAMGLVIALTGIARADSASSTTEARLQAMQTQIDMQNAEIARLKGESWMTQRRAEEVKALIADVLADANTRASMQNGLTAGHQNGQFFLASPDNNFLLNIGGLIQARYVYNHRRESFDPDDPNDNAPSGYDLYDYDDPGTSDNAGFDLRRARLWFKGHIYDPNLNYKIMIQSSYGEMILQDAYILYKNALADGWDVQVGQFKPMFTREEQISASNTMAVEASDVNAAFSIGYTQGLAILYNGSPDYRAALTIHDGSYKANTDWADSSYDSVYASDFAVAARAEYLVQGTMKEFDQFRVTSEDETGLLLGAAVDFENGKNGTDFTSADVLKWTLDGTYKNNGFGLFAAIIGSHLHTNGDVVYNNFYSGNSSTATQSADQYGIVLQGSYAIMQDKADVFARYEYIELDGALPYGEPLAPGADDTIKALTIGGNYYLHGNDAKLSLDLVYVFDPAMQDYWGSGLLATTRSGEFAVRAQVQLQF